MTPKRGCRSRFGVGTPRRLTVSSVLRDPVLNDLDKYLARDTTLSPSRATRYRQKLAECDARLTEAAAAPKTAKKDAA
jgi:hypothetical protein